MRRFTRLITTSRVVVVLGLAPSHAHVVSSGDPIYGFGCTAAPYVHRVVERANLRSGRASGRRWDDN